MVRRVILLLAAASCICTGQTSYERLAAAAKLWAYVKYCHPGATAADVDWDAALANATPTILHAKSDQEFVAAVNEMLGVLKDPATRMLSPAEMAAVQPKAMPVITNEGGVEIVRLAAGNPQTAAQARDAFVKQLPANGVVVFDLRGSGPYVLPESLPVLKASMGPRRMMRTHSGYANDASLGPNLDDGYESYWEMRDGTAIPQAKSGGMRAIFLVNRKTNIPEVALAMQDSGAGAIVSEDEIDDSQVDSLSRPIPVLGEQRAVVRMAILSYRDGTTGVVSNAVLHQTGAALKAALEMAKTGNWPAPPARPRLDPPPARFVEKTYADQQWPAAEYRMLAAARVWGVFHYFHPYRHLYGEDWDAVLTDFLPKMARAENARKYQFAVAEMVAHAHDSHCNVSSRELSLHFYGEAGPPVELRWIENQPVVTRVFDGKTDIRPGDVLTKIDGEPYRKQSDELAKYVPASTPQSMMRRMMDIMLRGASGSVVRLTLRRGDEPNRDVSLARIVNQPQTRPYPSGEVFRLLDRKVGYVDLEKLTNAQVDSMFELFRDTDAIIMDMRGYPRGTGPAVQAHLGGKPGHRRAGVA